MVYSKEHKNILYVMATPISNCGDIARSAQSLLMSCPIIVGEERKKLFQQLKRLGLSHLGQKQLYFLNEHTRTEEIEKMADLCQSNSVVLLSDCGTPNFCDPGAELVQACRKKNIPVRSVPGPSSLTAFISVCGYPLDEFVFRGFLPRKREERKKAIYQLRREKRPIILMDTPYRLRNLLTHLAHVLPKRKICLGLALGSDKEKVLVGTGIQVLDQLQVQKEEFVLLILEERRAK